MSGFDGNETLTRPRPAAAKASTITGVTGGADNGAKANGGEASPDNIDDKIASISPVDDHVEYVQGHPVIRNGMDVSRFVVSDRDDGDPALTFRSLILGTIFTALSSVITMLTSQSTYLSLPLKQQLNTWIGYAIWYAAMPALFYSNTWGAKKFPFMPTSLFASNGTRWQTTAILDDHGVIDPAKLDAVGLPYMTSSTAWGYFTSSMAIGALITHTIIFYRRDMTEAWKQARSRTQLDIHYRGMLKYKEVPMWWYLALFALTFVAGLVVSIRGETTLPPWGYVVSLLLGAFIAPFSCVLYGLYGTGVSTNQMSEMVAGVVHPGRPLANLYFAGWSHQVILLAVNLSNWLKVGKSSCVDA